MNLEQLTHHYYKIFNNKWTKNLNDLHPLNESENLHIDYTNLKFTYLNTTYNIPSSY